MCLSGLGSSTDFDEFVVVITLLAMYAIISNCNCNDYNDIASVINF